jgi:hypothetical protein
MPSVLNVTNLPAPRVSVIDSNTGLMTREWYRFFFNLFVLTGSGSNTESLQDLQIGPPSADPSIFLDALQDAALSPSGGYSADTDAVLREAIEGLASAPPRIDEVPGWNILPRGVTVGASPFTFQNTTGRSVDLIVTGGTVSAIAFSRDNVTFYGVGSTAGVFWLSPYDYLRVTYTVAPTITLVPR